MKNKLHYIVNRIRLFLLILFVMMAVFFVALLMVGVKYPWMPFALILFATGIGLMVYLTYAYILKPIRSIEKTKALFAQGVIFNDIFILPHHFSKADDLVLIRFLEMLDTQKFISSSKKEAEYLALQNQINPHFLYNTLEGIRSEALLAGVDTIAEMTEALATFFRYTISQTRTLVSLEDELSNIENYYYIQQFRFGDRLDFSVVYDTGPDIDETEILKLKLPKLTLQPIVENAIYHGLETKVGKGHLKIRISVTSENLIVKVSDDGMGMPEDQLNALNEKLKLLFHGEPPDNGKRRGGIAIQNVNNRIKLLFGERYGVFIYSKYGVGTDVNITLPIQKAITERI